MPKKLKNKNNIKNKDKLPVAKQKIPRHKEKFPALNFKRQVKTRLDALDIDYLDQLSDKDKAWLNSFLEETVITNFQHKGKHLYKNKTDKRSLYSENNARNRCIFTQAKAMNRLMYSLNSTENASSIMDKDTPNTENGLIALIDAKSKAKAKKKYKKLK